MGGIGAALHAMDEMTARKEAGEEVKTRFRGWNIVDKPFTHEEEICHRNPNCHNQCKLQVYKVGEDTAIYGGDCGMYESRQQAQKRTPDFNRVRQQLYFKYMKGVYRVVGESEKPQNGKITVGISRALSFHQMGLFWVHLFNEMGFDVVITPETNNKIVDEGIEAMTCEACFPVKISHGHAAVLRRCCDFMFMPLMIEMEKVPSNNSYYCPHVESNTYVLMAALSLDANKIIKPAIYLKRGKENMKQNFASEFKRLGLSFNPESFDKAYNKASGVLNEFNQEITKVGRAIVKNLGNKRAIVVVGRPYSLYDSRTNLNLFATFSRLGVYAIPQEFLDLSDIDIEKEYPNMYWGFGNKVLRSAKYINQSKNLFGLYLTSFSCGPDSFVLHFFNHEMNRTHRPYLELELDEHSAGAGVETRLLAFIDAIKNQTQVTVLSDKEVNIIARKAVAKLTDRVIYIPRMAEGALVLAAAFRAIGVKADIMPTYTPAGIEFGKKHTSGKECFPCIVTTGDMFDMIERQKKAGVDVARELAFFMPETEGPCRFGQYSRLHRILLDTYGYKDVQILSPSSENSYDFGGLIDSKQSLLLRKLAWQAVVYSDMLEKCLWRIRPYEKQKGVTDRVFERALKEGIEAIASGGGLALIRAAKRAAAAFSKIEVIKAQKPLIGIVGEIFVRTHKESNQQLVRKLEGLGCETYVSSVAEWINYTTNTSIEDSRELFEHSRSLSSFSSAAQSYLAEGYQRLAAKMISFPFRHLLKGRFDHDTKHILSEVAGIFSNHINGEAILSIGGALSFAKDGFNGVVNAMPFTCMPSTIASSILKVKMRQKAPFVDMVYDGSIQPNRDTNLETFVFQAKQNLEAAKGCRVSHAR